MAYEVGLLCDVSEDLTPEALVRALCAAVEPPPAVSRWQHGESWAGCEVRFASSGTPLLVQVNVADDSVARLRKQAEDEGLLKEPTDARAAVTFTVVGDVDFDAVQDLLRQGLRTWRCLLFDEVSGFHATID